MTPLERLFALEQFGIKLGLDNIRALLAALGNPLVRIGEGRAAWLDGLRAFDLELPGVWYGATVRSASC